MSTYAKGTSVASEQSRMEIERTLNRFGATGYAYDACAPLVDRFGGSLSVESAPGVGSCFTLEFDPSRPAR